MRDSTMVLSGVKKLGHREWFVLQALGRGFTLTGELYPPGQLRAVATVNHGRWIAECPLQCDGQPCSGSECVTEDDKVFLCLSCGNQEINGNFLQVDFPPPGLRHKFELSLAMRPEQYRNWFADETPNKLAEENRKHNLPVPDGAEELKDKEKEKKAKIRG